MGGESVEPEPYNSQLVTSVPHGNASLQWSNMIAAHRTTDRLTVTAFAWIESFCNSYTQAVRLSCDDGNDYVVKGTLKSGRTIVTDHVLGQLGGRMGAPVGVVRRVYVPQDLIDGNKQEMGHIPAGLAHGSLYVTNCFPSIRLSYFNVPDNRSRFASIAVFYGWTHAGDRQFCYERPNYLVHSFDHGHFLPNGALWDRGYLDAAPDPAPDPEILVPCAINASELSEAKVGLRNVDQNVIADVVASTPDGWGNVSMDDLESLADFLYRRCEQLKV
jgi:hypothetical protein